MICDLISIDNHMGTVLADCTSEADALGAIFAETLNFFKAMLRATHLDVVLFCKSVTRGARARFISTVYHNYYFNFD